MTEPTRGNRGELFPRPRKSKAGPGPARGRIWSFLRPASGLTLAVAKSAAGAVFLLQGRPNGAQDLPAAKQKPAPTRTKRLQVAMADRVSGAAKPKDTARPSLEFYTRGVRESLFSAPQPPKAREVPAPKPPKVIVPPVSPVPINPFADWTYSGTVTAGDKKLALLENRTSKMGQFVHEGQEFMGAKVKSVTDQMVTVVAVGKPYLLAKSDNINVTPLSASAAYLTAQAQQPQQQMGQNGSPNAQAMAAWMQMQAASGGQGMVLPNGTVLSPDRAARFNNRMNRRFDGSQGGGQGRGGQGRGGQGYGGGRGRRGGATIQIAPGG